MIAMERTYACSKATAIIKTNGVLSAVKFKGLHVQVMYRDVFNISTSLETLTEKYFHMQLSIYNHLMISSFEFHYSYEVYV